MWYRPTWHPLQQDLLIKFIDDHHVGSTTTFDNRIYVRMEDTIVRALIYIYDCVGNLDQKSHYTFLLGKISGVYEVSWNFYFLDVC